MCVCIVRVNAEIVIVNVEVNIVQEPPFAFCNKNIKKVVLFDLLKSHSSVSYNGENVNAKNLIF